MGCCLWDDGTVLNVVCGTVEQRRMLPVGRWNNEECCLCDGGTV